MKKLYIILIVLSSLILTSCRKSARNQSLRSHSKEESIVKSEEEDVNHRRNKHSNDNMDNRQATKSDETLTDNDNDINITPHSTERRITYWSSFASDNIDMLQESCDYNVPKTKGFANKLAGRSNHSDGTFNIEQLCEIFDYCYNKWRYVNDPRGSEYLAKASETIASSLTGDCDDFAILISSCMLAIGGDICIVIAQGAGVGHAYAEVDISQMNKSYVEKYIKKRFPSHRISTIVIRQDNDKMWLNLDWSGDYPGGPTYKASNRNYYKCINGKWSCEN